MNSPVHPQQSSLTLRNTEAAKVNNFMMQSSAEGEGKALSKRGGELPDDAASFIKEVHERIHQHTVFSRLGLHLRRWHAQESHSVSLRLPKQLSVRDVLLQRLQIQRVPRQSVGMLS